MVADLSPFDDKFPRAPINLCKQERAETHSQRSGNDHEHCSPVTGVLFSFLRYLTLSPITYNCSSASLNDSFAHLLNIGAPTITNYRVVQ